MRKFIAGMALAALVGSVKALVLTPLTYTVGFDFDYPACCGVDQDFVVAESYSNDYKRYGFAEFNLSGLSLLSDSAEPVLFSFVIDSVYDSSQYFGEGARAVYVDAFVGANQPSRLNVRAPIVNNLLSYDFGSFLAGSKFTVDVSSLFHQFQLNNSPAFGVRFVLGAYNVTRVYERFTDITLTVPDAIQAIPEPSSAWLLLAGLPLLAMRRQRVRASG